MDSNGDLHKYMCYYCTETFATWGGTRRHMRQIHNVKKKIKLCECKEKFDKNNEQSLFSVPVANRTTTVQNISEEELVEFIIEFFRRKPKPSQRKDIKNQIRLKWGRHAFGEYGYGCFQTFMKNHGINMNMKIE